MCYRRPQKKGEGHSQLNVDRGREEELMDEEGWQDQDR